MLHAGPADTTEGGKSVLAKFQAEKEKKRDFALITCDSPSSSSEFIIERSWFRFLDR
jgi:hypothetical protein